MEWMEYIKEYFLFFNTSIKDSYGRITIGILLLLILGILFYLNIPSSNLDILLQFALLILPIDLALKFPSSKYVFWKYIGLYKQSKPIMKEYCTTCLQFYTKESICYKIHKLDSAKVIVFSVNELISMKLKQKEYCKTLLKSIKNSYPKNIEDLSHICHGRVITSMRKFLNLLYPIHHFPLAVFVDGVAAFKSSFSSIYPGKYKYL